MLINPTLQGDFNSLLFSPDAGNFQTNKSKMIADIQSAMLTVDNDPDAQSSLQLLLAVVDGWTYAGFDDTTPPGPPTAEMMQALQAALDYVVPDLTEIFDEILEATRELRQMMQAQEALVQTSSLKVAEKKFETEKQEAQSRYSQAITEASTQMAGGGLGLFGAVGGVVFAVKASRARTHATETGEKIRIVEKRVNKDEDEVKALVADGKRLRAERDDLSTIKLSPKEMKKRREELRERIENNDLDIADLRTRISDDKGKLSDLRSKQAKFEGESETYLRASQIMDKFGAALSTTFTSSGRLGGAQDAMSADMLRAEAGLYGAFLGILESQGRSYDSFAQMCRQAMVDAVQSLNGMLQSQGQLAEHLGQTV